MCKMLNIKVTCHCVLFPEVIWYFSGGWPAGWLGKLRIQPSYLSTKLKLKLKMSLAIKVKKRRRNVLPRNALVLICLKNLKFQNGAFVAFFSTPFNARKKAYISTCRKILPFILNKKQPQSDRWLPRNNFGYITKICILPEIWNLPQFINQSKGRVHKKKDQWNLPLRIGPHPP